MARIFAGHRERTRIRPMEREMLSLVPTGRSDEKDACGCTPPASSPDDAVTSHSPTSASAVPATTTPDTRPEHRSLQLVVPLTPAEGGQYRAALALGAADCDPVLRSVTVPGLAEALEQVPMLRAEAEAHWRHSPRNPATTVAPPRRTAADRPRSRAAPPP